jgi:hypothetical protein
MFDVVIERGFNQLPKLTKGTFSLVNRNPKTKYIKYVIKALKECYNISIVYVTEEYSNDNYVDSLCNTMPLDSIKRRLLDTIILNVVFQIIMDKYETTELMQVPNKAVITYFKTHNCYVISDIFVERSALHTINHMESHLDEFKDIPLVGQVICLMLKYSIGIIYKSYSHQYTSILYLMSRGLVTQIEKLKLVKNMATMLFYCIRKGYFGVSTGIYEYDQTEVDNFDEFIDYYPMVNMDKRKDKSVIYFITDDFFLMARLHLNSCSKINYKKFR